MYYDIPDSGLTIRIWDGGMNHLGHYCLDFFDPRGNGKAVNTPRAWKITYVPTPGNPMPGGQVVPWERAFGVSRRDTPPGEERHSVREGSRLALLRDGHEPVYFQIPTRAQDGITWLQPRPAHI